MLFDLATHAMQAPAPVSGAAPPEWVHLLPAGRFSGADGRGPYTLASAEAVIVASMAGGRDLVIDRDHATDLAAPHGRPADAVGWITALQAKADGLWGQVAWNRLGTELLTDRRYRFLSPVFLHTKAGEVRQLVRASLTNDPNLLLTALASRQPTTRGPTGMDEFLKTLRAALGLPDTADGAALAAHAKLLTDMLSGLRTAFGLPATAEPAALAAHAKDLAGTVAAVRRHLHQPDTADGAALVAALQAAAKPAEPDPAKYVGADVVKALQAQLDGLRRKDAERYIDAEAAKGKTTLTALRDHYIARHMADPAAVEKEIAAMVPVVTPGVTGPTGKPPGAGATALTGDQMALCARMNVAPEAYFKTLQAEGK